jgi:hypothetical protein
MSTESVPTLQKLAARIATLEAAVAALTTEKKSGEKGNEPRGAFASLGGIEILPAPSTEAREKPIDFSEIGGRQVARRA